MKGTKNVVLSLLLGLGLLSGCARHYIIKLNNGLMITTASKPELKGAKYYFKDAKGQENSIPEGRVVEIEPASMAKHEKSPFTPTPEK